MFALFFQLVFDFGARRGSFFDQFPEKLRLVHEDVGQSILNDHGIAF